MTARSPHALLALVTPWLWTLANRYAPKYRLDRDDVFQAAVVQILHAAAKYDSTKSKPSTWATWQFRAGLARLVAEGVRAGRARPTDAVVLDGVPDRRTDEPADTPYLDHLLPALAELPPRHRQVLELRHGLTGDGSPRTLAEIARPLGVTRERVRQIEKVALARLRTAVLESAHPAA